jgi:hypothetical protein
VVVLRVARDDLDPPPVPDAAGTGDARHPAYAVTRAIPFARLEVVG